ncbi:MAG: hypothetical protein N3A38_12965 [Planctomycetota bacterium]|nr:hypothetical protein [Planctomycetota bacterium]
MGSDERAPKEADGTSSVELSVSGACMLLLIMLLLLAASFVLGRRSARDWPRAEGTGVPVAPVGVASGAEDRRDPFPGLLSVKIETKPTRPER